MKKEMVAARLSRGWCVGDAGFKKEMRQEAAQRGADQERYGGLEPEELRTERALAWEERLSLLVKTAKIDLKKLAAKKSHPDKALLAAATKRSSSVPNG